MVVTEKSFNTVINIGSGIELPIKDIYDKIVEVFGAEYNLETKGPREGDIRRSVLDASKAKGLMDWKPEVDLEKGLKRLKEYMGA